MATFASTDVFLMLQVKAGNRDGFDLLVQRHRGELVGYLYRMVYNHAIAEELAQEAFLRAYRSRARYEPTARFTTWLFRIATRLALNWIRDNHRYYMEPLDRPAQDGRSRQLPDPEPLAESVAIRSSLFEAVRTAVQALPERQRAVVIMHKFQDMTYHEIAESLHCSPQAVKSMLFRAHSALREKLAGEAS